MNNLSSSFFKSYKLLYFTKIHSNESRGVIETDEFRFKNYTPGRSPLFFMGK